MIVHSKKRGRSIRLPRALVANNGQVDRGAVIGIELVAGLSHVHAINDAGCVASLMLAERPQSCVIVSS